MTFAERGVAAAQKLQHWFRRRVLQQPWMMDEFASPILQESLLLDKARCDAYREAIPRRRLRSGKLLLALPASAVPRSERQSFPQVSTAQYPVSTLD
jgi:hypothetical protein